MTKQKVIDSILIIANKLDINRFHGYQYLIDNNTTLPELTRMISYDMFLLSIDTSTADYKTKIAIENIRKYCQELQTNGYVKFLTLEEMRDQIINEICD